LIAVKSKCIYRSLIMLFLTLISVNCINQAISYDARREMEARAERLKEACSLYSDPRRAEHFALFQAVPRHNRFSSNLDKAVAVCVAKKAGWAPWSALTRKLWIQDRFRMGPEEYSAFSEAKTASNELREAFEKGATRITMVRHPLERILDGYFAVFVNSGGHKHSRGKIEDWLKQRVDPIEPRKGEVMLHSERDNKLKIILPLRNCSTPARGRR